jgi:hypothetical protein
MGDTSVTDISATDICFESARAAEESHGGKEEAAGGGGHEDDGVAVSSLGSRWGGGGVVAALGAALRVGEGCYRQDRGDESDPAEV